MKKLLVFLLSLVFIPLIPFSDATLDLENKILLSDEGTFVLEFGGNTVRQSFSEIKSTPNLEIHLRLNSCYIAMWHAPHYKAKTNQMHCMHNMTSIKIKKIAGKHRGVSAAIGIPLFMAILWIYFKSPLMWKSTWNRNLWKLFAPLPSKWTNPILLSSKKDSYIKGVGVV